MKFNAKRFCQTLAAHIRNERAGAGNGTNTLQISLRKAAKQMGISAATLSRVERGGMPDLPTFAKIVLWLDLDADMFIEDAFKTKQQLEKEAEHRRYINELDSVE